MSAPLNVLESPFLFENQEELLLTLLISLARKTATENLFLCIKS